MLAKRLNYGDTIGVTGVSNNIAGESLEQFYQFTNSSRETLKEQDKEEAEKRIKYRENYLYNYNTSNGFNTNFKI